MKKTHLVISCAATLGAGLLLLGCNKKSAENEKKQASTSGMDPAPTRGMAPAPTRGMAPAPTSGMAPAPTGMGPGGPGTPGAAKMLKSPMGTFAVPGPAADWRCNTRQVPRGRAELVVCRPKAVPKGFFVMYKAYDNPPASKIGMKDLFQKIYMKNYRKMFKDVKILREGPFQAFGQTGYQMTVLGKHPTMGVIMHQERGFMIKNRIFLVTISGKAAHFKKYVGAVTKMLEGMKILMK